MEAFVQQDIESDEGLSLTAYPDPITHGEPMTIGFGTTGPDIHKGTVWTLAYATIRCEQTIEHINDALTHELPFFATLDAVRQGCLINMAYNLGVGGLLAFHRTLAAIDGKRYEEAAADMLASKWAKQVPNRAKRLARQMATGVRP